MSRCISAKIKSACVNSSQQGDEQVDSRLRHNQKEFVYLQAEMLFSSLQVTDDNDLKGCLPRQQSSEHEGGEEEEQNQSLHCCTWNTHGHIGNIRKTITKPDLSTRWH